MITLKHLKATNFKTLGSVDLIFPERGSVLIEGHNEAGKSTLFEAVFVALYGKPLVGEDGTAKKDEVIQHGQSCAAVELSFKVGEQEIRITRVFERGKAQQAKLTLEQPGMPREEITRVRSIDERILKELGNLDGDSLRNSCFVEQKELGRIEDLVPARREQAIQKLLGLERLIKLLDQFKFNRQREQELRLAQRFLQLAQVQNDVRRFATTERELAERLDAIKGAGYLEQLANVRHLQEQVAERWKACELRIQEMRQRLERCETLKAHLASQNQAEQALQKVFQMRAELQGIEAELEQLSQIEHVDLPRARAYLNEIVAAVEASDRVEQARQEAAAAEIRVREAERSLNALEQAEVELRRKEEGYGLAQARLKQRQQEQTDEQQLYTQRLDGLNKQKTHLEAAYAQVKQWETAQTELQALQQKIGEIENRLQELSKLADEVQSLRRELQEKEALVATAQQEMQTATNRVRLASGLEALATWIRLKDIEKTLASYTTPADLLMRQQEEEKALIAAKARTRTPLLAGVVLSILCLLALGVGIFWFPVVALMLLFGIGALVAWLQFLKARKLVQAQVERIAQQKMEVQRLEMQRQAAIQMGGDPAALPQYEAQLRQAELPIPSTLEEGRTLSEKLQHELGGGSSSALQLEAQEKRGRYTRLVEQFSQLQTALNRRTAELQRAQQAEQASETNLESLKAQAKTLLTKIAALEEASRTLLGNSWPTNSATLYTQLSTCIASLNAAKNVHEQQVISLARLLREANDDVTKAQIAVQDAQAEVSSKRALEPAKKLLLAQQAYEQARSMWSQRQTTLQQILQKLQLAATSVAQERVRANTQVNLLEQRLRSRSVWQDKQRQLHQTIQDTLAAVATTVEQLFVRLRESGINLAGLRDSLEDENVLQTTLDQIRAILNAQLKRLDEQGTKATLERAIDERGRIKVQQESLKRQIEEYQQDIDDILRARRIESLSAYTLECLAKLWPLVLQVSAVEENEVTERLDGVRKQLYAAQEREKELATELQHPGTPLSIEECERKVQELVEERRICEIATGVIRETHDRIARRVLPITERNMQPILQQLTGGRYRDVRLTPEENNGQPAEMDYRIRVWDPTAQRFVAKNLFSGGTRDQCSLALRLAFALATLPQELGVAPGFIFLDEPLSAFDAQRAQALVELLTTGIIAQQFNQVVLISHYHAFDREAFQYHIRMEAGQVIESDLPQVEMQEALVEM